MPSSRWLMVSDRITSGVTTPPALRITCASPSRRAEEALRRRFHEREPRGIDKILGQVAVTQVDGENIGVLKQFFFADESSVRRRGALRCQGGSPGDEIDAESRYSLGNGAADSAES